jgi:hypothetical protein
MNTKTMNTKTILKIVIVAAMAALVLPGAALAQDVMSTSYQWNAPSTGSTVVHYVVQHLEGGGDWVTVGNTDTNSYTLDLSVGVAHTIRVAGVDSEGRQGPWSVPSDPYMPDPGAPGQPGKPILF